ncbi:MAG: dockerin type I domain-containing protein, partial [Candidatus Desantisbacteria bacterium]
MNVNPTEGIGASKGQKANGTNGPGKDFIKLFNQAIGKTSADIGWTDRIEEVPILGTGYKNLDKNVDGRVDIEDLKAIAPEKANDLSKVNQAIGKKVGDSDWEDKTRLILGYNNADVTGDRRVDRNDLWLVYRQLRNRYHPRYNSYNPRYNSYNPRYDVNKDGRIDYRDIHEVYRAMRKRIGNPGWEDRLELIKEGAKRQDFNQDGKIDKEDLFTILKEIENLQLLRT